MFLLQNTLGTIEGDYKKVLSEMKSVAKKYKGEIIISAFCQEALKDWGIKFYTHIQDMVGEPDLKKTDFKRGLFVSRTGYASKWWSSADIDKMKNYFGGKLINQVKGDVFHIIHISFTK